MKFLNVNDKLGFAGEVASRTLFLQIEEEYLKYNIKVELKLPDGEKYGSGALEDKTQYILDEYALSHKGFIEAQIVAYDDSGTYVVKSPIKKFLVCESVNAGRDLPDIYKLQEKEIEVTETETEVTPDPDYYGLKKVKILADIVEEHSDLSGLDFDESGHTGFQREITFNNKLSTDLVDDTNSSNKFTNTQEKTKLANIETGAQVNKIESISVNGVSIQVDANKNVDLDLTDYASEDWVESNYYNKLYSDINYSNLISKTYNELAALKANNGLVAGQFYRITDYVTTVNGKVNNVGDLARATGNQFDLIIQAISNNAFSELATPILHNGDTYFASENLKAWKVWYCFENDTNRFEWADSVNGKGVIYRLIDEFENDVPYDFKNIQFKRFTISAVADSRQSFMVGLKIGVNGQSANITSDTTTYDWCYTFSTSDLRDASLRANYVAGASSATSTMAKQNIIGQYLCDSPYYRGVQALNDFVIKSNNSIDNKFGDGSHSNTIYAAGNDVMYNYFGSMFRQNVIALYNMNHNDANECFESNVIGKDLTTADMFQWNVFGSHFNNNICIWFSTVTVLKNAGVANTKFATRTQSVEMAIVKDSDFSLCTIFAQSSVRLINNSTFKNTIIHNELGEIMDSTIDAYLAYCSITFMQSVTITVNQMYGVILTRVYQVNITANSFNYITGTILYKVSFVNTNNKISGLQLGPIAPSTAITINVATLPDITVNNLKTMNYITNANNKLVLYYTYTTINASNEVITHNLYSTDNGTTWLVAYDSSSTITDEEWTDLREGL